MTDELMAAPPPAPELPGPLLISLKPGTESLHSLSSQSEIVPVRNDSQPKMYHDTPERMPMKVSHQRSEVREEAGLKRYQERAQDGKGNPMPNGLDVFECPPPKTENELLQIFYRQQDEIRRLRELVNQRDVQIKQLALEIKNVRNSPDGH